MRFRTQISNVPLLHKIIRSLASLAKVCVIRLSAEKVHFIISGNEGKDGVQVWSQVKVATLFTSFRIESNSENEIWLETDLNALLKVLKSADSSVGSTNDASRSNTTALSESEVSLKLNKRSAADGSGGQAIWVFDIKGNTASGRQMSITHELDVKVLSKKKQDELNEPMCPPPDVHLVLPSLLDLRNIVSRLDHLADDVKMSANHEGAMELTIVDNCVDMVTAWRNLHIPTASTDADGEAPPKDKMFSTTVSIKGFLKFLNSHLVGGTAIACICEKHCIIAYVYIGEVDIEDAGGVLTFFIPAKNFGDD